MKNRYHVLAPLALLTAAIVVASPGVTRALRADFGDSGTETTPTESPVGRAGLQYSVNTDADDASTGATLQFSDAELNAFRTDAEGLEEVVHPDGSVSIDLQGRFQSATVATVRPDGTLEFRCVGSIDEAHAAHCPHTVTHRGLEVQ